MQTDEYLKLAEVEDRMWYFRSLHAHIERELAKRLVGPATVLDAGCGTGGLIRRLATRNPTWKWSGVDMSSLAISLARQHCNVRADLREASITALPFEADTFDAVASADVLCNVKDEMIALHEFFRVLKPGGVAILNLPAYQWMWSYHDTAVHSVRRYGRIEVMEKLRAAGFVEPYATHWNTLPFPLIVVRRKLLPSPREGGDVMLYPAPIEAAFNATMAIEQAWIRRVGRLPFGCSVFAVARKPAQK